MTAEQGIDKQKPRHKGGAFMVKRNGCLISLKQSASSPVVSARRRSVRSAAHAGNTSRSDAPIPPLTLENSPEAVLPYPPLTLDQHKLYWLLLVVIVGSVQNRTRKPLTVRIVRGFESLPLRHINDVSN